MPARQHDHLCRAPYLQVWTARTRCFDLEVHRDLPFLASRALLLLDLPLGAEALKDHLGMTAAMDVGVVVAHISGTQRLGKST